MEQDLKSKAKVKPEWNQYRRDILKSAMKFLEGKIANVNPEGSKRTRSPENDPTPTKDTANHQSEVTQQDGLGLDQEPVHGRERRRIQERSHALS